MADVLLVSAREDYAFADGVAASLEQSGLSVAQTDGYTRDGESAPCVLVLWSVTSGRSAAIRNVALRAQHEGRLIAGCLAGGEPPLGFSRPRPFDLSNWDGDPNASSLDPMFFAVDRLVCAARLNRGQPEGQQTVTPIRQSLTPRAPIAPQMPPMAPPSQRVTPIRAMRSTSSAPQQAPQHQPQSMSPHPAPASPLVAEAAAWKRIEHSEDPTEFLNYLTDYGPEGLFAELAQMRLDKLSATKAPPRGAFIPHNPSPHVDRQRPIERPRQATPPPVRPRPAPPPMDMDDAPAWREAPPQAPRMEAAPRPVRAQARRRPQPDMAQQVHLPPPPMQRSSFRLAPVLMIAALVAVGAAVFHFTRQAPQTSRGSEIAAAPVVDAPMDNNNGYAVATPLDPQMSSSAGVQPQAPRRAQATPPAQPRPRAAPSKQETAAYVPPVITFSAPAEQAPPAQQPAAAAPPAPTPAPQAAASPYISPVWTRRPTSTALVSAYPSQAADRGVSGQVTLDCGIFGTGALACTVASESPSKMGFGRAALAVANGFRAAPTTASGEPTAGKRVRVPISFKAQE